MRKKLMIIFLLIFSCIIFVSCGGVNSKTPYKFIESINNKSKYPFNNQKLNIYANKLLIESEDLKMDFSNSEIELESKRNDLIGKIYLTGYTTENGIDKYYEVSGTIEDNQLFLVNYSEDLLGSIKYVTNHEIIKKNLELQRDEFTTLLLDVVNKLTSEWQTSPFIEDLYNSIYKLERINNIYILSLNYDGIKSYINDLLTKPLNDYLLKLLDKKSFDYDKLIDDIYDLTIDDIVDHLKDNGVSKDEISKILDEFATYIYEEKATFTEFLDDEFDLEYDTSKTIELLSNKDFLDLEIGKEIITEKKKDKIKNQLKSFMEGSLLDLIFEDVNKKDYQDAKESLFKEIDTLINVLKENLVFDYYFDKKGNLINASIEFKYDFTDLSESQIIDDIQDSFSKDINSVDINIEINSDIEFGSTLNKVEEDKKFVNGLNFKETDINSFTSMKSGYYYTDVEPVYKKGILDGFYFYCIEDYRSISAWVSYCPINLVNASYKYDCNSIIINLDYSNENIYMVKIYTDDLVKDKEMCAFAKDIYDSIDSFENVDLENDEYVRSIKTIDNFSIIYNLETKDILVSKKSNVSLHEYSHDEELSIYTDDCRKYNYDVYRCENCGDCYVKSKRNSHTNEIILNINLQKYGIYKYMFNLYGCKSCNTIVDIFSSPTENKEYSDMNERYKYDKIIYENRVWYIYEFYKEDEKIVSLSYFREGKEFYMYINYDKDTKTYDEMFTISKR